MNLRIVSPEATALGLETHVCELQLSLLPLARIKVGVGWWRIFVQASVRPLLVKTGFDLLTVEGCCGLC
jgi:hypothetical protein